MAFQDLDGDGVDDRSGLPRAQHEQMEAARGLEPPGGDPAGWIGYEPTPEEREDTREGIRYADENHPARRSDERWRAMQESLRHEGADTTATEQRQRAEDYAGSDERTSDLDSGAGGRYGDADREYREAYDRAQRGYRGEDAGPGISDFDRTMEGTPILGWLTGADARAGAARAEYEADRARRGWDELDRWMPSADDLAVEYGQEAFIGGPEQSELARAQADAMSIDAQRDALRGLQDIYRTGGMTEADQARQRLAYEQAGMAARAQRDADMAQLQARGMGGSGAQVASMLSGQQGAAMARSTQDAEMLIEAQRRQLQAIQAAGGLGSQMRGQSFDESATRGSAADDFNRWQTEYARDRERFNTQQRDRSGESRSRARQQQYDNRERQQAGRTNQWAIAAGGSRADQARQDQANQAATGALGSLLEEIL